MRNIKKDVKKLVTFLFFHEKFLIIVPKPILFGHLLIFPNN